MTDSVDLQDACRIWQGGMEGGSSPIRAAARNLTGIKHYFAADFITKYEDAARENPTTTARAAVLLKALEESELHTAEEWAQIAGVDSDWVGRGIQQGEQDAQILESFATGEVNMPLWGASFDPEVCAIYGDRFTFIMHGAFPAVPAWLHSGIKAEEQELICGGRYRIIEPIDLDAEKVQVHLEFVELNPLFG